MTNPEFPRALRIHEIGAPVRHESLTATPAECAKLAKRFDLVALDALTAELDVHRSAGAIRVAGRFHARGAQPCVVSAEPVPFDIDDVVEVNFSDGARVADEEIELTDDQLDELPLEGDTLDLGELVAQSLALALDPWPRAPEEIRAAAARHLISEAEAEALAAADKAAANPFAVLKKK